MPLKTLVILVTIPGNAGNADGLLIIINLFRYIYVLCQPSMNVGDLFFLLLDVNLGVLVQDCSVYSSGSATKALLRQHKLIESGCVNTLLQTLTQ